MPSFSIQDGLFLQQFLLAPGHTIWVNRATGSDTVGDGDGSNSKPYRTLARAAQDLRNGRNDVIVVEGDLSGEARNVKISNINNFAIIGLGTRWDLSTAGTIAQPTNSASAPLSGRIRYTLTGHGFVVGDRLIMWNGVGATGTRPNGIGEVFLVPNANQFDVDVPQRGSTFPNTTEPRVVLPHLSIFDCDNVLITGLSFDAAAVVADTWGGLYIHDCINVIVADCAFLNSSLAVRGPTVLMGSLQQEGRGNIVTRCTLAPLTLDLFAPQTAEAPSLMLQGLVDPVFRSCILTSFHRNASNVDAGWEEGGGRGFIHIASNPGLGAVFMDCQVFNRFGEPLGAVPPDYASLVHLDDPNQSQGVDRVFFRGNFFQDSSDGEPVLISDSATLQDRDPLTIPLSDGDAGRLIWRRLTTVASAVSGSMGELVVDRLDAAVSSRAAASQVSGVASQVSGVSGQVAALDFATPAQVSGVSGVVGRNFGGNTRTQLFIATAAVSTAGRFVPTSGISHMRVETREADSGPLGDVHFVWFSYVSGATKDDAPATSQVSGVAPADGSFTSVAFPS